MRKDQIKAGIGIVLIIVLFFLVSFLVQNDIEMFKGLINPSFSSMLIYVFITIVAIVFAPISTIPLLPIASSVWGWFLAGILSIIGWTIGALIAFGLARKYGMPLVKRFVSLDKIAKFEKMIPEKNIFWSIVFLRMAIPVDVLSYVLGLFSHIKFRTYFIATLIGITPFAFIFAYVGMLEFRIQVLAFLIAVIVILFGYFVKKRYRRN